MDFLEKIKSVVKLQLTKDIAGFEVKLDSSPQDNEQKYSIDSDSQRITFFITNLSYKESKVIKKAIRECFYNNVPIIEESKDDLLQKLYRYNNKEDNQILAFFKDILSKSDYEALRNSLFLRNQFKDGLNIFQLKSDIVTRYGERGNMICNLCTAGYFENMMMPIFNRSRVEFFDYWDKAVDRGIMALFVNAGMTIANISKEIERRAMYGLSYTHIHGIGDKNIKKIKSCLKTEKEKGTIKFTVKNVFEDKVLHIYVAELIF